MDRHSRAYEKALNREGFYRAFKTKADAEASAKQARKEFKNVTINHVKKFGYHQTPMYIVYRYNKK